VCFLIIGGTQSNGCTISNIHCYSAPPKLPGKLLLWRFHQPYGKITSTSICHTLRTNQVCSHLRFHQTYGKTTPPSSLPYSQNRPTCLRQSNTPLLICHTLLVNSCLWQQAQTPVLLVVFCCPVLWPCALPYLVYGVHISYVGYTINFTAIALPCPWYTFLQFPVPSMRPTPRIL